MRRREALWGLLGIGALARAALAQQGKTRVIGLLDAGERTEWWAAFRQQLRELGYVEGPNISFVPSYAAGRLEKLPAMAEQLVRRKVDLIVTSGTAAAVAAKQATDEIPIVMATGSDQVSAGLARSLSHPGENVTGVTSLLSDLTGKRFALLREMFPALSRIAVVWHRDNASSGPSIRDLLAIGDSAKVSVQNLPARDANGIAEALAVATRARAQALVVVHSPLIYRERRRIAELALEHKLPTMNGAAEYVEAGGLASYAPSYPDLFRRAAGYVDRIFKGANPADLPIEQPTKFELLINQKTARTIGVSIPTQIMVRADRVIGAL
jgi:putative ABC transport system substrate-binding protein